jgi:lysophospholipase L1-like esterase
MDRHGRLIVALATVACTGWFGCAAQAPGDGSASPESSSGGGRSEAGSANTSGGQGSSGNQGSSGGTSGATSDDGSSGDEASAMDDADEGGGSTSGSSSGGSGGGTNCVKGKVMPSEVVMLGDSYLDPAYSNAGLDFYADAQSAGALAANTTYRHYYQGGASMNNGALQFNIPYQYETQALTDGAAAMPKDIQVIVMDGGGNDVLINDRSCLTSPPPGNTGCVSTIQGVITRTTSLLQEMASNGTKNIIFFFYPHLDPNGGGLLPSPNTVNETLDYAYPLAEQICCGSSFTSTAENPTCSGMVGNATCTFVDTRPAFGNNWSTLIKTSDYVHPTPAGAQIIADLLWKTMTDHCIAQ